MKNKLSSILILSIVSTLPLVVAASDSSKTYFSAGVMNITDKGLDELKQAGKGVTIDDSDTVANFSLGYKVSPNLALEGSIISGGEVSASLSGGESGTFYGQNYSASGTVSVKAKSDSSYLFGLKYSGESGPLSFNIKAGQLFWDVDYIATASGTITYGLTTYSGSSAATFHTADGSDPYIGFGVSYALSKNSSIDLDYVSSEINDSDISGYSLSLVSNF